MGSGPCGGEDGGDDDGGDGGDDDGIKVSLLDQTGLAGDDNRGWGGCVAFLGQGDEGRDTIYIADDDGIDIVVQEGEEIDGELVAIFDMGPMAVSATGQIAFWARLSGRDAIVRADPATGPGGGPGGDDDDDDVGGDGESGGCLSVAGGVPPVWRRARPARAALDPLLDAAPWLSQGLASKSPSPLSKMELFEAVFLDSCLVGDETSFPSLRQLPNVR